MHTLAHRNDIEIIRANNCSAQLKMWKTNGKLLTMTI